MKSFSRFCVFALVAVCSLFVFVACGDRITLCEHDRTHWVTTLEPTCTEEGAKELRCIKNGEVLDSAEISAVGHNDGVWFTSQAPTCTEKGVRELRCTRDRCDSFVLDTEELEELGHDYQLWNTINPTCLENGGKVYRCINNNEHTYTDLISKLGHDGGVWTIGKHATCTDEGLLELRCSRDSVLLDTSVIEAFGHIYISTNRDYATCTEEGLEYFVCGHDSTHKKTETLSVLGHDAGEWVTAEPATCTAEGLKELRCLRDSFVLDREDIDALGHDFELANTVNATCVADGKKTYVCGHDSTHTKSETLSALGHDAGGWVTAEPATCTTDGFKELRCSRDSFVLDREDIDALGHNFELANTDNATCVANGKKTYVCSNDSTHTKSETLSALGHDDGEWVTVEPATCTTDGFEELQCTRDAFVYESKDIKAFNHDYGDWQPILNRPFEERICSHNSQHKEQKDISKYIALNTLYDNLKTDKSGIWLRFELEEDAYVSFLIVSSDSNSCSITNYRQDDFIFTALYTTGNASLTPLMIKEGLYYVRFANTKEGETVGSFSVNIVPELSFDETQQIAATRWQGFFHFTIDTPTYFQVFSKSADNKRVSFEVRSAALPSMLSFRFNTNENGDHTPLVFLPKAGAYTLGYFNSSDATAAREVVFKNITAAIAAAEDFRLGVMQNITADGEGKWYRFNFTTQKFLELEIWKNNNVFDYTLEVFAPSDYDKAEFIGKLNSLRPFTDYAVTAINRLYAGEMFVFIRSISKFGDTVVPVNVKFTIYDSTPSYIRELELGKISSTISIAESRGEWIAVTLPERMHLEITMVIAPPALGTQQQVNIDIFVPGMTGARFQYVTGVAANGVGGTATIATKTAQSPDMLNAGVCYLYVTNTFTIAKVTIQVSQVVA